MNEKSKDSSSSSRAWLLQSCGEYNDVVLKTMDALRKTKYFDMFYYATDLTHKAVWWTTDTYWIPLKKDFGWSDNIINALAYVREKTFFMGCEDHLLVDFDEELVNLAYTMVYNGHCGCVRLTRKPQITVIHTKGKIPYIDKSYKYYVSCQPTVWNKDYLESIIRPGETAWQFEICASQRAKELELPAGVTYKTAFNYRNLIDKGRLVDNPKTYTEIHGT